MSYREQLHDHGAHHWKARMKEFFVLPCSHVPKRPEGITPEELALHGADAHRSHWTAIDGEVYDVTQFMPFHPGGELIMQKYLGRDCTAVFAHHHAHFKVKMAIPELLVGPLLAPGVLPAVRCAMNNNNDVSNQTAQAKHAKNDGDDDDDEAGAKSKSKETQPQQLPSGLNFEERETLESLFNQLLKEGATVLSDAEFNDFLNLTGVNDEEKKLTLSRLSELRAQQQQEAGAEVVAGVSREMFLSLF